VNGNFPLVELRDQNQRPAFVAPGAICLTNRKLASYLLGAMGFDTEYSGWYRILAYLVLRRYPRATTLPKDEPFNISHNKLLAKLQDHSIQKIIGMETEPWQFVQAYAELIEVMVCAGLETFSVGVLWNSPSGASGCARADVCYRFSGTEGSEADHSVKYFDEKERDITEDMKSAEKRVILQIFFLNPEPRSVERKMPDEVFYDGDIFDVIFEDM